MVSSKDVAKLAGVSQTTVSRVLNAPDRVKKPTLDKVLKAIRELNYVPDANARSLVGQNSNTIALLSGPLHNPFFVDTTTAIVNYANEFGYKVNVQFVNDENLNEAYETAIGTKIDGVILSCILFDDPFFDRMKKMNIPFITYNRKHKNNDHFVEIDNFEAGYLSVKHLVDLNHKKISWVGGPLSVSTFKHRYEGFLQACEDFQLEIDNAHILQTDTSKESCEAALKNLLDLKNKPTAICSGSDSIALNLLNSATTNGVKIPEELSIVGIDNVELSQHGMIQLSTIGSVSERNLGLLAIEQLIKNIENKKNPCINITESVKVFERGTTKRIEQS